MTVTAVRKDPDALSMTIVAEFAATPDRVWRLWADPRQLERWFGPPGYPATVTEHDLTPGGRVAYHFTGPEGDEVHGYLEVIEAQPPLRLVVREGFASEDGLPGTDAPGNEVRVTIEALDDGRTQMSVETIFPSREAMEELLAMGMQEGFTASVRQIDAVIAGDGSGAPT